MVLNVVARRRNSGGPESTTARMARSPSASRPAAPSSLASGLFTHRARPNASSAAQIVATTAIVPRMTQSATMAFLRDAEDLARITVPTSTPALLYTGAAATTHDPVVSVTGWPVWRAGSEVPA